MLITQRQTLDEKVEATVGNPTRLFGSAKARELPLSVRMASMAYLWTR